MISAVPARPDSRATSDEWFSLSKLLLLLAAFVVMAFPTVVTGASSFFYRDMGQFGYPLAQFHREAFWRGEIPLWNPLNNCGLPFLAQWNTFVLYPAGQYRVELRYYDQMFHYGAVVSLLSLLTCLVLLFRRRPPALHPAN